MQTFLKYHIKEYLNYTLLFFIVFILIISLIKWVLVVEKLIEFNPSFFNLVVIFLLILIQFISFTLPLSAFMGVLFSLHRMGVENEILGFYTLGLSIKDFLKPLLLFAFIVFVLTFINRCYILPRVKRTQKLIKIELIKKQMSQPIPSKKPYPLGKNGFIYVVNSKKEGNENKLEGIFFLTRREPQKTGIFIAKDGAIIYKKNLFILNNGWGFFRDVKKNIEILKFEKYILKISFSNSVKSLYFKRGEKTLKELKNDIKKITSKERRYRYLTEYYHRFLYAFSVILLTISAFILSFYMKVSHKFLIFFLGMGFYLIFYTIYDFLISLAESGKIHPLMAYLIFYGLFIILLSFMYLRVKKKQFG